MKTRLLWVYEGLAEYLGEVLMVRSGLVTSKEYRETLASTIGTLSHHEGRRVAVARRHRAWPRHLLRGRQPQLERAEARVRTITSRACSIWLEADAIIRERTEGKKSLDDFCRKFLGDESDRPPRSSPTSCPRSSSDLQELADFDWEAFLQKRVVAAARRAAARGGRPVRLPPPVRDRAARRQIGDRIAATAAASRPGIRSA